MKKSELAVLYASLGEEKTLELLLQLGETDEGAKEKINDALGEVEEAKKRAELAEVTAGIKQALLDFGDTDVKPLLPEDAAFMEMIFCYTAEELEVGTSDSPQTIPAGFYIKGVKYRDTGMDKAVNLFRGSRHKPNGNGGTNHASVVVPVPKGAPFKSWVTYVKNTYTEEEVPRGKGKSAPVGLRKVKDAVYLEAQRIKVDDNRQADWDEVKDAE